MVTEQFNLRLNKSLVPTKWKNAITIIEHKNKISHIQIENYRPMSMEIRKKPCSRR